MSRLTVGPIDALPYTEVSIDGFSEHGSVAPLAIHEGSGNNFRFLLSFFEAITVRDFIVLPDTK